MRRGAEALKTKQDKNQNKIKRLLGVVFEGVAEMLSGRFGGQDPKSSTPGFLKGLCRCSSRAQRESPAGRSQAHHPTQGRRAEFCKADFGKIIFASIFKKAKLALTSKAGGLCGPCGLRPQVKHFSGSCRGQVGKQVFSRMLLLCPYLGILTVDLQGQKIRRYFQEPTPCSLYSDLGGDRD